MNNKAYVLILFGMDDYFNTIQAIGGVYLNRQEAEHVACSGDILQNEKYNYCRVKEIELNKISDVSISLCD